MKFIYSFEYPNKYEAEIYESLYNGKTPKKHTDTVNDDSFKIETNSQAIKLNSIKNWIQNLFSTSIKDNLNSGYITCFYNPVKPKLLNMYIEPYDYPPRVKLVQYELEDIPEWASLDLEDYLFFWEEDDDLTNWL